MKLRRKTKILGVKYLDNNNNTHIWIIVHGGDQVMDEGLQGPGRQVVVVVVEAGVALLLGLVQILVVAAGEGRSLRHVVLQRRREEGEVNTHRRC